MIKAYGASAADRALEPIEIVRREPGPRDVQIDIAYCGVCHSDLHIVRNEWQDTLYPCVPGHEVVGHVSAIGAEVSRFTIGQAVAVGCMVGSCQRCAPCAQGLESYCETGFTATFNSTAQETPGHTLGGYSQRIVVDEKFVFRIPHPADQLAAVAPLLCAGITTYSPLRHWRVGPGMKVGVVGIGGLGTRPVRPEETLGRHSAPHRRRSTAIAFSLSLSVLIGASLGPLLSGAISDLFNRTEGIESLRQALTAMCFFLIPASGMFVLSGRFMRQDLEP